MKTKTLINPESQSDYFDNFSHCNYLKNNPDDSPLTLNEQILNHMNTDHYDYLNEEEEVQRRATFFKYVFRTCLILLLAFIVSLFFSCATVRTVPQTWVCKEVYKVPGNMYVHKFISLTGTRGYDEIFDTVLFSENDTMKCYFVGKKIYIIK